MTTIRLNGEERRLDDGATVQHALDLLNVTPDSRGVAVAVDREVVPRGSWHETPLHEGAAVEVVMAIQGG
jgi:sulfur carrier protein